MSENYCMDDGTTKITCYPMFYFGDSIGYGTMDGIIRISRKDSTPLTSFSDLGQVKSSDLGFSLGYQQAGDEYHIEFFGDGGSIRRVNPVPEPTMVLLPGSGLIGLARYGQRTRKQLEAAEALIRSAVHDFDLDPGARWPARGKEDT